MKEIELSNRDLEKIKDIAHSIWMENPLKHDNLLCHCYTEAFIIFLNCRNYICMNGKVYEKSEEV